MYAIRDEDGKSVARSRSKAGAHRASRTKKHLGGSRSARRTMMLLSRRDAVAVNEAGRGPGEKAVVTDKRTGRRYRVFGAPCSIPTCYCAALARPEG